MLFRNFVIEAKGAAGVFSRMVLLTNDWYRHRCQYWRRRRGDTPRVQNLRRIICQFKFCTSINDAFQLIITITSKI